MDEGGPWAITLYVPDGLMPAMTREGAEIRGIMEGTPDLAFIIPGWWEHSHTVKLALLESGNDARPWRLRHSISSVQ